MWRVGGKLMQVKMVEKGSKNYIENRKELFESCDDDAYQQMGSAIQ